MCSIQELLDDLTFFWFVCFFFFFSVVRASNEGSIVSGMTSTQLNKEGTWVCHTLHFTASTCIVCISSFVLSTQYCVLVRQF